MGDCILGIIWLFNNTKTHKVHDSFKYRKEVKWWTVPQMTNALYSLTVCPGLCSISGMRHSHGTHGTESGVGATDMKGIATLP